MRRTIRFDTKHVVDMWQYDWKQIETVFAGITRTHVLTCDSDGALKTEKSKTSRAQQAGGCLPFRFAPRQNHQRERSLCANTRERRKYESKP